MLHGSDILLNSSHLEYGTMIYDKRHVVRFWYCSETLHNVDACPGLHLDLKPD